MRDLERDRPALAHRLEQVVDRLKAEAPEPAGHLSTGGAAAALDVSVNTAKKWVRLGFIREFWTLPGSGYLKIARSEVERIKAEGMPRPEQHGTARRLTRP
ncbi:MAG: hypothetical protein A2Z32_11480 [Chloroflexi bacterium RBG_16_69_14]|nr:MAG: hypothetical protein A2Z32_11480 [Chloroflexi bacterium RBG_16_69_14]